VKPLAAAAWAVAALGLGPLAACSVQEGRSPSLEAGESEQLVSIALTGMT